MVCSEFGGLTSGRSFAAGQPVDASRLLVEAVIARFEPGIGQDQDEAGHAGGQAEERDQGKSGTLSEIADGDDDIVSEQAQAPVELVQNKAGEGAKDLGPVPTESGAAAFFGQDGGEDLPEVA